MDKITNGKRAIGQNRWGNWFGYSGGHRLFDFGTDEYDARIWLRSPEEYAALKAQSLSNAMIKRITDDGMANILAALGAGAARPNLRSARVQPLGRAHRR